MTFSSRPSPVIPRPIWVLIAFNFWLLPESTHCATFSVSDGDVAALKSAIVVASSNGQDDVIQLAEKGIYVLTAIDNSVNGQNGLPVMGADGGKSVTIDGRGAVIRRDTAANTAKFRILCVGDGAHVTISRLTVSDGYVDSTNRVAGGGGGILNYRGNLNLERCTLTGNFAITGGGLLNYGATGTTTSIVSECAIHHNTANYYGGGIYNYGSVNTGLTKLTVINTTICDNVANFFGGGITEDGLDGPAPLTIASCTFSGNNSGPGKDIWHYWGEIRIGHTILNDFDALYSGGAVGSDGYNLTYGTNNGWLNSKTDGHATDLKLDPAGLQDNGGPTKTIALLPGSPVVDAGSNTVAPARDQRGYLRNGRSDIGAFEFDGQLLRLVGIARDNDIVVSCEVVEGKRYRLQRKLKITESMWQDIFGVNDLVATGNNTESITDPGAISFGQAFYRVLLLP